MLRHRSAMASLWHRLVTRFLAFSLATSALLGLSLLAHAFTIPTTIAIDNGFTLGSAKVAGAPFTVTIRALDAGGNLVSDFTGTVALSDITGTISPNQTSAFTGGVWTGQVSITRAYAGNIITAQAYSRFSNSSEFTVLPDTRLVSLALTSGNNQYGVVGNALPNALIAKAADPYGNPINNAAISFLIAAYPPGAANQQLSTSSGTTGTDGRVATTFTLGTKIGTYAVTARLSSAGTSEITFYANASPGAISTVEVTPVITIVPKGSTQQFFASAYDQYKNPVINPSFVWTASGGGLIDQNGVYTAGSVSGNYPNSISVSGSSISAAASVTIINETSGNNTEAQGVGNGTFGAGSNVPSTPSPSPSPSPAASPGVGTGNATSIATGTGNGNGDGTGDGDVRLDDVTKSLNQDNRPDAGVLDRVYVTPTFLTTTTGSKQLATAQAYDKYNNSIADVTYNWQLSGDLGSLSYTSASITELLAGTKPGNGTLSIRAVQTVFGKDAPITKTAEIPVAIRPGLRGSLVIEKIEDQKVGEPFSITITAKDDTGNTLADFTGPITLTDATGSITPSVATAISSGIWKGQVKVLFTNESDVITAIATGLSGTSNSFKVTGDDQLNRFSLRSVGQALASLAGGSSGKGAGASSGQQQLIRNLAAGIASGFGLLGAAIGVGLLAGRGLEAIGRNPFAKGKVQLHMYISIAAAVLVAIFSVIAALAILG